MTAPINVEVEVPSPIPRDWGAEAEDWKALNRNAGGNPDFYPLTVKAAYVVGLIHDLCESVSTLLQHPDCRQVTYMPAFGVFASGIDLLGRCLNGNDGLVGVSEDLRSGFQWLSEPASNASPDVKDLAADLKRQYRVSELVTLRHFALHGQATARRAIPGIHYDLLGYFPKLLGAGLDRWWYDLKHGDERCNQLAKANVMRLRYWPIHKSWIMFEKDAAGHYRSITDLFAEFDWTLSP